MQLHRNKQRRPYCHTAAQQSLRTQVDFSLSLFSAAAFSTNTALARKLARVGAATATQTKVGHTSGLTWPMASRLARVCARNPAAAFLQNSHLRFLRALERRDALSCGAYNSVRAALTLSPVHCFRLCARRRGEPFYRPFSCRLATNKCVLLLLQRDRLTLYFVASLSPSLVITPQMFSAQNRRRYMKTQTHNLLLAHILLHTQNNGQTSQIVLNFWSSSRKH